MGDENGGKTGGGGREAGGPQNMAEVLASIRELVSAETDARLGGDRADEAGMPVPVLMLTPQMRVGSAEAGEVLSEGVADLPGRGAGAPILDEEALRGVVNAIVREELQGEMGDRISRNLRKLVRREIALVLREERGMAEAGAEEGRDNDA